MKLEFLPDGAEACPLLRLHGWGVGQVTELRGVAEQLAAGSVSSIALHRLPFVEVVGDITFEWVAGSWDRGVVLPDDSCNFVMQLPREQWQEVVEIIRPFERSTLGYNWLLPVTEVEVLLSLDGSW